MLTFRSVTRDQLSRLLRHNRLRRLFETNLTSTEGLVELDDNERNRRSRRTDDGKPRGRAAFEKVPSENGRELMHSGDFGTNERLDGTFGRKKGLAYRAMMRELAVGPTGRQKMINSIISQVSRAWIMSLTTMTDLKRT
jgi:DDB1- and CUL4-associated factor 11